MTRPVTYGALRSALERGSAAPRAVLFALVLCAGTPAPAAASLRATLNNVERLIDQWQIQEAAALLAPLLHSASNHPRVLQLQGEILINQGEYRKAHDTLKQAVRASRSSLPLKALRDLAGSTADTVKGHVKHVSQGGHFEIWTTRGKDELLVPFAGLALLVHVLRNRVASRTAAGNDYSGSR